GAATRAPDPAGLGDRIWQVRTDSRRLATGPHDAEALGCARAARRGRVAFVSAKTQGESRWPAPAKLNLFLHVTGRRPDGYHDLQTAFQLIDFCDWISIQVLEDGVIERVSGHEAIAPEADLAVRAARALQAASGTRLGASLRVSKRIPIGGGLGGGSSDAATTLLALNHLWGTRPATDALSRLGLALRSDRPLVVLRP